MGFGPLGTSCAPALNIFSSHGNGCLPGRTRNPSPLLRLDSPVDSSAFEYLEPCDDDLLVPSSMTFFLMAPTPCDLEVEEEVADGIGKL
ncbi:hypothetical protein PRUPE_4G119900 [Prunus persica]|uniref:Uncharacterized protein n=1 Tax=Prunus persica TaxID=3760 RepID=A0A251PML9_PRUPE|nr:hypothetical protein PRUPE_4G119900 [Prunus persica]